MKKILFIILLAVNSLVWAGVNTTYAGGDEEKVFSQIKSLDDARAYISQFPEGKYKQDVLNRKFPLVSRISFHSENRKRSDIREQHYKYNNAGNIVQKKSIFGFGKSQLDDFQYDESGKLVKKITVKNGVVTSITQYEYSEDGLRIKETEQYPKGNRDERYYKYYDSGLLSESSIHINGIQIEKYKYQYNSDGNKSYSEKYSQTGILGKRFDQSYYQYDEKQNLIKVSFSGDYKVNGNTVSTHNGNRMYIYDSKNNCTEENYMYESQKEESDNNKYHSVSRVLYKRNSDGLLIEKQYMNLDDNNIAKLNKKTKYSYTYIQLKDSY